MDTAKIALLQAREPNAVQTPKTPKPDAKTLKDLPACGKTEKSGQICQLADGHLGDCGCRYVVDGIEEFRSWPQPE